MRTLLVLRHAKSDWDAGAVDHQRPLNERGVRSARLVGEHLAAIGGVPDLALTSSATRARSTLELAAEAGAWGTDVTVTDDLYDTDVAGTLDVIAEAPHVARLLVVGHEPTWSRLVRHLTGADVVVKTATLIELTTSAPSWAALTEHSCAIASITQSRHLIARDA